MHNILLNGCENWLKNQYQTTLNTVLGGKVAKLRWFGMKDLRYPIQDKEDACALAIEDDEIGWLLYLVPYESTYLEQQVNQVLGFRSGLLREANYTGNEKSEDGKNLNSTWRVGITWLVQKADWPDWQHRILEIRRESGIAEEISIDAVCVENKIEQALDQHGLPRLLMHTRALLKQSAADAETWLSVNAQITAELKNFSQQFTHSRTRTFARELEETIKNFQPEKTAKHSVKIREFKHFNVKNFRNLKSLEIAAEHSNEFTAHAVILFGPNGTGKSSFAEALSLGAFGTSQRLEKFLEDKDIKSRKAENYLREYLISLDSKEKQPSEPSFIWNNYSEQNFSLNPDAESKGKIDGVILSQEDSLGFATLSREQLSAQVLKGYSDLADHLFKWIEEQKNRADKVKRSFMQENGLHSSITNHATAYNRLALNLLERELYRPLLKFLEWLKFLSELSGEDGQQAARLVLAWVNQKDNFASQLAGTLAKLQEASAADADIIFEIREKLNEFDKLANETRNFRKDLESRIGELREKLDQALTQIDAWGVWLATQTNSQGVDEIESQKLKIEMGKLSKERAELEKKGKTLRGRLDLLGQAEQFLSLHWSAQHSDTCPVCDSNVTDRKNIETVVGTLQKETTENLQTLRVEYVALQKNQKEIELKFKMIGVSICPVSAEDQVKLKSWLECFLPVGANLEDWLIDDQKRMKIKNDLARMKIFPATPEPYAEPALESQRLANEFIVLCKNADEALDDPEAIAEIKKILEERMEKILMEHLPATLGKVWKEITLALTTARWLLPALPMLKLGQRGKSLSIQLDKEFDKKDKKEQFARYIYNAAEQHTLGMAWFFTYYLARRRFEEAWVLLDDPAQEMDQPSFRELTRFWETLLRLHNKKGDPFTLIVALHQEERALDVARATNGRLYILGWQKTQEDSGSSPSVKKVVLLAPGFHPLEPEKLFFPQGVT